ncbi:AraC family transcriptional regulator [Azoarcus taiwanensis]|uniref:Helix-turn-helix domain-containing protein n=1 Tax=Azoarcus taiwanensis TaxID=666964 RepID=A0A972F5K3_9RHOO|nr:AraC family transcriptional regulator [Azoarcus taiwanensis]NMG01467.1 helix-turn-helix domain-containing protein [Azoarcus taiwanensis]
MKSIQAPSVTVPIRMVRQLLDRLDGHHQLARDCIKRAGIAPALLDQDSARVTVEQFAFFYRTLAVELDDETPGLFSRPLRAGTLKFLCLGMLDAANLRVALYRYCWFFRLVLDDLHFEMGEEDGLTRIMLVENADFGCHRTLILELMLMLVQGIASWMIERKLFFARVDLSYPTPDHAREYINMYAGPARFDQARTALYIEPSFMNAPIRQDKASLSAFLRKAPMDWIHVSVSERVMTHRVRDLLEAALGKPQGVEDVARALHISPRTLARRLAAEGTHFQAVKDALRRDVAIARISRTEVPIGTIGADLGFDDPTAFNRAFKQWTGTPPGSYRRTLAPPATLERSDVSGLREGR